MVDCHGQQLSKVPRDKSQACIIFISGSFQELLLLLTQENVGTADNKYDFCHDDGSCLCDFDESIQGKKVLFATHMQPDWK